MNQFKIEWSYLNSDNKRIYQVDVLSTDTAKDAVKELREEYRDLTGVRIEDVYRDGCDSWDYIEPYLWEE